MAEQGHKKFCDQNGKKEKKRKTEIAKDVKTHNMGR